MQSNSVFDTHQIDHLSPSSINLFVEDIPLWIMTYLFKIRDNYGVGAVRGTVLEKYLHQHLTKNNVNVEHLLKEFNDSCDQMNITKDEKYIKEQDQILRFYSNIKSNWSHQEQEIKTYQEKVEVHFEDIPVPIHGYTDFVYEKAIVDLKTTFAVPSKLTEAVKRQMACYSMVYPEKESVVSYYSPSKTVNHVLNDEELDYYKNQLGRICHSIQNFLSMSTDKYEIASKFFPNFSSWKWSDYMKNEAKQIWRV